MYVFRLVREWTALGLWCLSRSIIDFTHILRFNLAGGLRNRTPPRPKRSILKSPHGRVYSQRAGIGAGARLVRPTSVPLFVRKATWVHAPAWNSLNLFNFGSRQFQSPSFMWCNKHKEQDTWRTRETCPIWSRANHVRALWACKEYIRDCHANGPRI